MKIGFIWNAISDEEYKLAESAHREQFACFHIAATSIKETFVAVFKVAKEQGWDFCILSHRSAWATNPEQLRALLDSDKVQQSAAAIRVGTIYAKAGVFSPKLPYIDPDFIIVNIRRCEQLDIPTRLETVQFTSHFMDMGGVHADLLVFLETIFPYGAIHVYDDGTNLMDIYGRKSGFKPTSCLVDLERGFISCDVERDPRVKALRAPDGLQFLKEPLTARLSGTVSQRLKNMIQRVNFEIDKWKSYADPT